VQDSHIIQVVPGQGKRQLKIESSLQMKENLAQCKGVDIERTTAGLQKAVDFYHV
jgi:hypothetical protein